MLYNLTIRSVSRNESKISITLIPDVTNIVYDGSVSRFVETKVEVTGKDTVRLRFMKVSVIVLSISTKFCW